MAGNNDEKIVRLPQLDRLTKSLDARNSTIIQNVHDELISAVEDVEKKLFSKDYNDLTNKPLVNTVINEKTILAEWDGNEAGRSIGSIPTISCSNCVKVADLTEDQELEYFEKINTNGCVITIDPGDGTLIEQVVEPGKGYSFMDYCNFIKPETNGRALVVLSGKAWSWYINHADQYINDPGIYFYNVDGYKVVKLEILDEINQCVSTNDIFVNDKKLATEDFVNNAIDNIPEGFSGDYNDLINKPCCDTRVIEPVTITYNGDATGKETGSAFASNYVKVCDITEEEFEAFKIGLAEGYTITYTDSNGNILTKTDTVVNNFIEGTYHLNYFIIFTNDYKYDAIGSHQVLMDIPSRGVYFRVSDNITKLEFNKLYGEFKVLEPKFLINSPGNFMEKGKEITVNGTIYTVGNGAEIYNDYERNIATGEYSHAEGYQNKALGDYSHAEGIGSQAIGIASHAEAYHGKATGKFSHAEGMDTEALGEGSHAEGDFTHANGELSHTEGDHTIASGRAQHVQGKYNIEDTENKYAHIVGNGSYGNLSNAHTLDWDGNAWFAGDVFIKGTSQDDAQKLATMDDIIELEEDILSMEGMIDNTYPNLITQDKTILGAINELARMLNGLTLMPITQEDYDALAEKNPNVIYIVTE